MTDAPFGLTEKEREVLRLLAQGHDVKSAAFTLRLSVHTVNERLREARLKTQTSSSRGAARLLVEREDPQFSGPLKFGVTPHPFVVEQASQPHAGAAEASRFVSQWGPSMLMSAAFVATVLAGAHVVSSQPSMPVAPSVVSTFPTLDAVVEPGRINLSVTFDRPMRRRSYSFVQKSVATYPNCDKKLPAQSADGRTIELMCEVEAGHQYEVWFNRAPYMNFRDQNGVPAVPFGLRFRTR
jgi:DNA-binding CsgD family transcriptional regulator